MLNIDIKTISHNQQRYETCGDYYGDAEKGLHFRVSSLDDCYSEFLIALHEQIEYFLCRIRGISNEAIDKFDIEFEANRIPEDESEPGDHIEAPYHNEHMFAIKIEKMVCEEFGINWNDYEQAIQSLFLDNSPSASGS